MQGCRTIVYANERAYMQIRDGRSLQPSYCSGSFPFDTSSLKQLLRETLEFLPAAGIGREGMDE